MRRSPAARRAFLAPALALLIPAAAWAQPTVYIGDPSVPRTAPQVEWVNGYSPAAPATVALSRPRALPSSPAVPGLTVIETLPRVRMAALPSGPTVESALTMENAMRPRPAAPAVLPPVLGFEALSYDDNFAFTGNVTVPPDPDMAVGPDHVLGVINVSMGAYSKTTGAEEPGLPEQSLQNFFGSATRTFDPKALYDQFDDRYLVVTLERVGNQSMSAANESRILLAASPTGTPAGAWQGVSIEAKITEGGVDYWCDYPGFAVDEEAIYITCNYFRFTNNGYLGTRLYTVDKADLYAGTFSAAADLFLYDPQGTIAFAVTTMQPAQPHTDPGGSIGTWLSSFSGLSNGTQEFLQVIRIDDPLAGPGATFIGEQFSVGDICPGGDCGGYAAAPQQGAGTRLQTNDPRALDAEWRDGGLWLTATINSNTDSGQATAHWWRVLTNTLDGAGGLSPAVIQGDIDGEDIGAGTYTFFPSISVNDVCAFIGFSASSNTMFAGSYYASVNLGTLALSPSDVAKAGEGTYQAFDGSPYRWGDYTGTEVDFTSPNDGDFWTFNEYAQAPTGGATTNEYSTWFAKDNCFGEIPVELMGFDATADGSDVELAWETASETSNAGFEVERRGASGTFERLGFVDGAGTTSEARRYVFRDAALLSGRYTYRLRQVDLDGTSEFSPEVEVAVGLAAPFALGEAFPNPSLGTVQFTLAVQREQEVTIEVFDTLGRLVVEVFAGSVEAEQARTFSFDASGLPSGLYVYRAAGETFTASRSVTVLR